MDEELSSALLQPETLTEGLKEVLKPLEEQPSTTLVYTRARISITPDIRYSFAVQYSYYNGIVIHATVILHKYQR